MAAAAAAAASSAGSLPFFIKVGESVDQKESNTVSTMLKLQNGYVLVVYDCCIHVLGANLTLIKVVGGEEVGFKDGEAANAQFRFPSGLAQLPDRRVLVADAGNHRIRVLSADLQKVDTVAGDGEEGHRDGAAEQARFSLPSAVALLPDRRVLVADYGNNRIRVLSADLQNVSTVAGNGQPGHEGGKATNAQFYFPKSLALLPDGRVLVADNFNGKIRVLSADLQYVGTVTKIDAPEQIVAGNDLVLVLNPSGGWILNVKDKTKRNAFPALPEGKRYVCISALFKMQAGLSEKDSTERTCILVAANKKIHTFAYADWRAVANLNVTSTDSFEGSVARVPEDVIRDGITGFLLKLKL